MMDGRATREVAGPLRILSDLHLAHGASRIGSVGELRPLLEGAQQVVFNGDSCEQVYSGWRDRAEEMRVELIGLCRELGITPHFLAGNHDPWISELGWLTAGGGRVFITHGDLVLRNPSPWSREFLRRKREVLALLRERGEGDGGLRHRWETLQRLNRMMIPDKPVDGPPRFDSQVLNALWPPERLLQILRVWALQARHADRFVERFAPDCRVFLCGHFHRPLVEWRGGRLLCNTGAFVARTAALLVDVADGGAVVREVVRAGGVFRPGREVARVDL